MTFSYASPLNNRKDRVRFILGDTFASTPLLDDEEILWLLDDEHQQIYPAAIRGCESILAKLSQEATLRVSSDTTINLSERHEHFAALLVMLRRRALSTAKPWAGGISVTDKAGRKQDTGRTQEIFARHEGDYPGTIPSPAQVFDNPELEP